MATKTVNFNNMSGTIYGERQWAEEPIDVLNFRDKNVTSIEVTERTFQNADGSENEVRSFCFHYKTGGVKYKTIDNKIKDMFTPGDQIDKESVQINVYEKLDGSGETCERVTGKLAEEE